MIGSIIGGAFGLLGAMQQRQAMKEHNEALNAGFNLYKPYLQSTLAGSKTAFDQMMKAGPYTGPTYAGPNSYQLDSAGNMARAGLDMQGMGRDLMASTSGFGQNAADLYNQYQQLSDDARADRLATAIDYASANTAPLLETAMRDSTRRLTEQTLPGINRNASATGNINSSRAGVADALATRAYEDRAADMAADIQQQLIDRSLNQQAQQFADRGRALQGAGTANSQVQSAFGMGANTLGQGGTFASNAGSSLQGFEQAAMDAAAADYNMKTQFPLNSYMNYMNGILGRAPNSSQALQPNLTNPMTAALGGAMSGYGIQQQYFPNGFGGFGMGNMGGGGGYYGGMGGGFTQGMTPYAMTPSPMML